MKTPLAISAAVLAATLFGDTITWTGDGDGKSWNDTANWEAESTGQAPVQAPLSAEDSGDQVVISGEGVTVEYNGGDPRINANESLTISDGATLVQTSASWWYGENGTVTIDGGTFDTGSCSGTHTWANFYVSNGGTLIARTAIPDANITLDSTSTYEMVSDNAFAHTGTEKFTKFTATAQNVELTATADTATFADDITWSCKLISAAGVSIIWQAGSLVTWDTAYGGYYNAGGTIDIAAGWTGSFTFAYTPANVYASCFQNKITYNGSVLTAETFAELFDVEATTVADPFGTEHQASRVSIAAQNDWKIGTLSSTGISSTGATVAATVTSTGSGEYSVYCAVTESAITEAAIVSIGEPVTESEGSYTKTLTGLTDLTVYNYAFAIVTNNAVAAFKTSSFVASDYDYILKDGEWFGSVPTDNLNNGEKVLVMGVLNQPGWYVNSSGSKKFKNAEVTLLGMQNGAAALEICNSSFTSKRADADVGSGIAAYGIYNTPIPLNFTSANDNNIINRAASYTCYATETQCGEVYTKLFNYDAGNAVHNRTIQHNGVAVTEEDFRTSFTTNAVATDKEVTVEEESVPLKQLTITLLDTLSSDANGAWTVKDGARVKLTGNVKLASLTVEGTDVVIDLNGYKLKAGKMSVAGEKIKGDFTSENLSILAGEGSLEAGKSGLVIKFR